MSVKKITASLAAILVLLMGALGYLSFQRQGSQAQLASPPTSQVAASSSQAAAVPATEPVTYQLPEAEQVALASKFADLSSINPETVAYLYAPGTKLDEPVVQTTDNHTYLDKTFDGGFEPEMGTVFMDMRNQADFSDYLTWLFGHARGSRVPDHRMFNDVNFYDDQAFFDQHPYVVIETPDRKYYYEAAFFTIVPETTAFYRTDFESREDFYNQLVAVEKEAWTRKADLVLNKDDNYLVLSTCREEDVTIRANLYLRQIPDEELPEFLEKHGDELAYQATR